MNAISPIAYAGTITYITPSGSVDSVGDPVDATAAFTTSAGQIQVVLNNLLINQKDVGQNISDLFFTVSTGQDSGTIHSSSGTSTTVNGDGSFVNNGTISADHWTLSTSGSQLLLNDLTGGHPVQTILGSPGSSGYTNANNSITGNSSHNPFLLGPVTFTLDVSGVTANSSISAATFSFGTTAGDNITGVVVPEPASLTLIAIGLGTLAITRASRHRRKRAAL